MKSKSNLFRVMVFGLILGVTLSACEEDPIIQDPTEDPATTTSISTNASKLSNIISLKSNLSGILANSPGGLGIASSAGRAEARKAMSAAKAGVNDDGEDWGDEEWEDDWEWETCADVSETNNGDGTITVVYDYGEGCVEEYDEEFAVTVFGKLTDTFSWTETEVSGTSFTGEESGNTVFENFGERFQEEDETFEYTINGTSEYSGSFAETYSQDSFTFSSEEAYKENLTVVETEEGEQFTYTVVSDVEETIEFGNGEDKLTVTKGDYSVSEESGESYSSSVKTPLVMLFSCGGWDDEEGEEDDFIFTFVSGVEEIDFEGETYTIDYGDGTCDNIITITNPDGTVETIDLGDWEDEEGDDEGEEEDEDEDDEDGDD